MKELLFVTTNAHKIRLAREHLRQFGYDVKQLQLEFEEIQADDGEIIARHKAADAFAAVKQPLIVTDDSWLIPGLNNFPGPYMHYLSDCLTTDDFLRLTSHLADRTIILRQYVVYQDVHEQKLFCTDITGSLLKEARGTSDVPIFPIISFDGGQHSVAEQAQAGYGITGHATSWHDLGAWLQNR